jgi:hypothetical protein
LRIHPDAVGEKSFPAWHFAEVDLAGERTVVSVVHLALPDGVVVCGYDDPLYPERCTPILAGWGPVNIGDYAMVLHQEGNMELFIALCRALRDLPDPLIAVQSILWMRRGALGAGADLRELAKQALSASERRLRRRRLQFDRLLASAGSTAD